MIFLRSLFFNIFLFGGIAVACIIAFPLLFQRQTHDLCWKNSFYIYWVFIEDIY